MRRMKGNTKGFNRRAKKTALVNKTLPPRGGYRI